MSRLCLLLPTSQTARVILLRKFAIRIHLRSVLSLLPQPQGFASTVVTTELDQDDLCHFSNDVNVLLNHTLPKSRTRTNVVTADYTPEVVCLVRTQLEEWVSLMLPLGFRRSRRHLFFASSRPRDFAQELFFSAQLNAARSLPVHKNKTTTHLLHLNLPRLISLCLPQVLYMSCRTATLCLQLLKR